MKMLAYNLFLLFKFDSLHISEYSQQSKTVRLKYVLLAGKIFRTARYVVMKLSANYSYKDVYEKCLFIKVVSNIPVVATECFTRSVYHTQCSASQELFVKFMAMWCRNCYNI